MKDKSYSLLTKKERVTVATSNKASPRRAQDIASDTSLPLITKQVASIRRGATKPANFQSKSLPRNNSVINRKDFISHEYSKIVESKLPNIMSFMRENEIPEYEYNDTDLLAKMMF